MSCVVYVYRTPPSSNSRGCSLLRLLVREPNYYNSVSKKKTRASFFIQHAYYARAEVSETLSEIKISRFSNVNPRKKSYERRRRDDDKTRGQCNGSRYESPSKIERALARLKHNFIITNISADRLCCSSASGFLSSRLLKHSRGKEGRARKIE